MNNFSSWFLIWLCLLSYICTLQSTSTRFYDFKVETKNISKLCSTKEIVTINKQYPGPIIYAQENEKIIVNVTNNSPYNITIHWHGVRQMLSCWFDGPSYITQCPIQAGQRFTYEFSMLNQKGTFFWHAHVSWLRETVHGALIVYPKTGVPYPFKKPQEEHIVIFGEYWLKNIVEIEEQVRVTGGGPPTADAFTINGHPGPNYNCSKNDVYEINVTAGKTYLLRLINAGLNTENFFAIANHTLTIVEADAEYTKPFTTGRVMLAPGQTMVVLVEANQPIANYSMATGPYESGLGVPFQNVESLAYFRYIGANPNSILLQPVKLPVYNDSLAVKTVMDGLRSLKQVNVPKKIDTSLFITIGMNVNKCLSKNPKENCQGIANGVMGASMNNITFVKPNVSILDAYYKKIDGYFTEDFPKAPEKFFDFVNGAPNLIPNNTGTLVGTRVRVVEYGANVEIILQNIGTITPENHPIHLHGYSFYVVGYGSGNYNPKIAKFNLVDPPYMNTIGVPVGGWAAIRFVADNPGVWFMHCHFDIHQTWGLGTVLIVKNGKGELQTLPHPPKDLPSC